MDNNPVITIHLDRVRELRFGHRAMKRWTAHTGKSVAQIDTDRMSPEDLEVLAYFMLEKDAEAHGEQLRLEQMEDLLDMAPLGVLYAKVGNALEAAFPEVQEAKNGDRAAVGTGSSS